MRWKARILIVILAVVCLVIWEEVVGAGVIIPWGIFWILFWRRHRKKGG